MTYAITSVVKNNCGTFAHINATNPKIEKTKIPYFDRLTVKRLLGGVGVISFKTDTTYLNLSFVVIKTCDIDGNIRWWQNLLGFTCPLYDDQ